MSGQEAKPDDSINQFQISGQEAKPNVTINQCQIPSQEAKPNVTLIQYQISSQESEHHVLHEDVKHEPDDITSHDLIPEEHKHVCVPVDVKIEQGEGLTQSHISDQIKCTYYLVGVKTEPADTICTAVTVKGDPNDMKPALSNTTCQTSVSEQINMKKEVDETITLLQKSSQQFESYLNEIQHDLQKKIVCGTNTNGSHLNKDLDNPSDDWQELKTGEDETIVINTCRGAYLQKQELNISQNYLLHHMVSDTQDKPYQCDMCGQQFNWKNKMTSHMMTHTGENL